MKRTEEKINWKKAACASALFFILLFAFWELGLKKGFPLYLAAPSAVLAEGLLVFLAHRIVPVKSRSIRIGCAVFSALLALSFAIGGKASSKIFTSFTPWDVVLFLAVFAVSCPILIWCADVILRHPLSLRGKSRFSPLQVWLASSAFLFLCWVSCLLIYYPGSVSPDSVACITRALGRVRLSNQQPLFYILLMKPFLLLIPESAKDVTAGVAAFLACQTLAMAVMTGYLFGWLVKQGVPRWVILCTGAYFTLNPVFPLYAITMWKDILFGGLAMIYVLNLIDIVRSSGGFLDRPRNMAWFLAESASCVHAQQWLLHDCSHADRARNCLPEAMEAPSARVPCGACRRSRNSGAGLQHLRRGTEPVCGVRRHSAPAGRTHALRRRQRHPGTARFSEPPDACRELEKELHAAFVQRD